MGFSENPKFFLLVKKILKRGKLIGITLSVVGFLYFCIFNKINKKADLDARTFTQFPGNSTLLKKNEDFFNDTNNYFSNYKYSKEEHIIDVVRNYITNISPHVETEKYKIKVNSRIDDYILVSNVPCKYCNNIESLLIVINFGYKERKYFHSLTIGLTLIDYLLHCNYMSKDVLFLFTNKELLYSLGIQNFIELYFYSNTKNRKNIIRSATIIEFDSIYPSHIQINYESLNGMLPNQDLILLLTNELNHYNIPIKIAPVHHALFDMALERKYEKGHTYFLRENIPSFTATGVSKIPLKSKTLHLFNFTKSLQSFLRSQSNTHEGFCHSSHFYFFNTIRRHVPISIYCYSVYLICCYCIFKLMKSSIFRNYINFLIGVHTYIITILIISLPIYLFSTNDKIYDFLNLEKKLPLCEEWHPDNFNMYIKIADYWTGIFIISIVLVFFFNYFISCTVHKFNKTNDYKKVEKIERVIILDKIKILNEKIKCIIGITHIDDRNKYYEQDITNSNDVTKMEKPTIIHSDDENFLREKKNKKKIKELQDEIDKMENELHLLDNGNLYNWSYSALFSLMFNIRHKSTNMLMHLFAKCSKYLDKSGFTKTKYFPEFLEFLCSNKIFDYLHLNKYYLNNEDIKFNYNYEINNGVLLNLYSLARNHYCIGSQTYPLLCFTFFPILFYIVFVFFC
ncbi:glycosylphosphatidylinositol anchor attachment 1 protein, putative (GPAA1) [Plasmodium ovale curtisi]|uniref:Glycosylphosphatidylinositol anchor attachment 1 protein, putative (GPAA1) n=1 Tax=Plasmodium ovale curtisi TaxID=864141 RepID=A0A1A8WPZ7_PLAOA|nr:glycosylphosphatidylinositol anchor attachment 1 protein, putative (GPAA1) [Plasmodium ovale curtisi]SBS93400.1 glycosylphosphatidylinositol anchor attachment 1 protein, putative (GPAA1) [Plasmodium ovale curtisi]